MCIVWLYINSHQLFVIANSPVVYQLINFITILYFHVAKLLLLLVFASRVLFHFVNYQPAETISIIDLHCGP